MDNTKNLEITGQKALRQFSGGSRNSFIAKAEVLPGGNSRDAGETRATGRPGNRHFSGCFPCQAVGRTGPGCRATGSPAHRDQVGPLRLILGGAPFASPRRHDTGASLVISSLAPPVHISYVPCAEPDKTPPKNAPSVGKVSAVHDHPTPQADGGSPPGTSGRLRADLTEAGASTRVSGRRRAPQLTQGWVPWAPQARYGADGGGLGGRGGCRGRCRPGTG